MGTHSLSLTSYKMTFKHFMILNARPLMANQKLHLEGLYHLSLEEGRTTRNTKTLSQCIGLSIFDT